MRPRNAQETQDRILAEAQRLFAKHGYRAVTVKQIADGAGVSPNLVTRYFGGKEGLFAAASQAEIATRDSLEGPRDTIGARLATGIAARWFSVVEDPLLVLLRASGERPHAAEVLADFLDERSLSPLEDYLRRHGNSPAEARDRAAAVDALVLGLSMRRRVLRSELGDRDELAAWLGDAIQRLVEGD